MHTLTYSFVLLSGKHLLLLLLHYPRVLWHPLSELLLWHGLHLDICGLSRHFDSFNVVFNGKRGVPVDLITGDSSTATHLFPELIFLFDTIQHSIDVRLKSFQEVRVDIGLRKVKALVRKIEKQKCRLSEKFVPPSADFLLKLIQLITEEVVKEEFTMKVWKHDPQP